MGNIRDTLFAYPFDTVYTFIRSEGLRLLGSRRVVQRPWSEMLRLAITAQSARAAAKTTERLVTCRISAEGAGKRRELRRREPTLINLVYVTRNIRAGFRLFFCSFCGEVRYI